MGRARHQGDRYVLYVNDEWVYDYSSSARALPVSSQMGVFVNDGPAGGRFTNFAIYSAPPLLPLP